MLYHGSCQLQGYFITLLPWNQNVSLFDLSPHGFPIWVQIHGLPLKSFNKETAKYFGDCLGKFICYDKNSPINGNGLRLQIYLSEMGLNSINLHWPDGQIKELSLVLEQVGRFCPHCRSIGHVAHHCKSVSSCRNIVKTFVVGNKSGSAVFDESLGCYDSNLQRNGIKLVVELGRITCKRKLDNFNFMIVKSKRPCLRKPQSSKRKFDHQEISASVRLSSETASFKKCKVDFNQGKSADHWFQEKHALFEMTWEHQDSNHKDLNLPDKMKVMRKRKRSFQQGNFCVFPHPHKKACLTSVSLAQVPLETSILSSAYHLQFYVALNYVKVAREAAQSKLPLAP